jgi:CheY-like chemotaxis protein
MDPAPTVLLIEDDATIRTLYTDALTGAGLSVLIAEDGETGLNLALAKHPQVVLIDIMMPGMNGHQVVNAIRKDAWGKKAHIIYLTNMADPENIVAAHSHAPEEYIIKSQTEIKDLVKLVRTAMYAK